ncbi:uncharacterized protein LOC108864106 [Galendromus occidentalis]|uniref:Uncharacterized protein LOC108864106 n=1 Tax=Galendromus occidentalis TaxID=34638 RepID=A0AAJ7L4H2_9ACAR|nr:uncharacterized protein LOC108864106 [Galendromus occidentalis]
MDKVCVHCRAKKFEAEPPGMCCSGGPVKLPELSPPLEPLASWLLGETIQAKHFLANIRRYNSCFQMTSFGATEISHGNFMPTFKVQGQIYHLAGSLLPLPACEHKFLQIYFMGNLEDQIGQRCRIDTQTHREIIAALQTLFDQHNALVRLFRTALELMPTDEYVIGIKADKVPVGEHRGRYNAPSIDEVAIVIVGEHFESRDIVLHRESGVLKRVSETHRSYDALQYPIIFWQGEDGYHFNIRMREPFSDIETEKKVSAMNYYSYRLMMRDDRDNHILRCRQLFHQYVVDMYAKIETERLLYIRLNQTKLRAEQYIHLRDAISTDSNINPNDLGNVVILPATFTGSPRHMHEYAQDALTYVRYHGRPDLFITFTCNPTWEEVKVLLKPGQTSMDRHDVIARVFKQKLKAMIDMVHGSWFMVLLIHMFP